MGWKGISLVLCVFGFLKEFRPSEPFVTDYLTGPWKNFTATQVNQEIFPVGTYSYLATLVLVFLLTDLARYKPVIVLCGLSGTVVYIIIILATTIPMMQINQFFFGLFMATEVAYYTYIYAKVDKKHYQEVTSHTRAAFLLGRFCASITGQLTVSFGVLNYYQLNFITLTALTAATIWAFFLPPVGKSIYFHRADDNSDDISISQINVPYSSYQEMDSRVTNSRQTLHSESPKKQSNFSSKVKQAYFLLWRDFLSAYTNAHVVKWSIWWAVSTCGFLQVLNYIQLLWQTSVDENDKIYNGAVEASYTIVGAAAAFGVGKLRLNWPLLGEATLSLFSFLEGVLLLIASQTYNIWVAYGMYIGFGVIYYTMITVASSEVAKNLSEDSYGLIFGINTLLALLLQSLLTFTVVVSLGLDVRSQYVVYGGYFIVVGAIFMTMGIYTIVQHCRSGNKLQLWVKDENVVSHTEGGHNLAFSQRKESP